MSPEYPLPPVRSVSQHRIGTAEEMQNYYELRPRIPDLTEDDRPRVVSSQLSEPRYNNNNGKSRSNHKRNSSNAAANKTLVQIKDPSEEFAIEAGNHGNGVDENNGDTFVNNSNSEEDEEQSPMLVGEARKKVHISSNTSVAGRRTRVPLSQSDVLIQYHAVHSDKEELPSKPLLNSNFNQEFHPDQNSINPTNKSMKETGAIPKRRKNAPIPSPLTIHPDEIISVPCEDSAVSPSLSASSRKQQRYNNFAH